MTKCGVAIILSLFVLLATQLAWCAEGSAAKSSSEVESVNLETQFCMVEYDGQLRPYRIFFPSSYVHGTAKKKDEVKGFPLVVACHPAGGDETSYFEWKGNPDRIQTIAEERGYIVACPALPPLDMSKRGDRSYLDLMMESDIPAMVMAVIAEVKKQRWIDDSRVYLMGASKGGMTTYITAAQNPETFAAIAGVVALFGDEHVEGLSKIPVLMWNATRDKHFSVEKAREMKEKLEAAGGEAKLVEVEGGHGGYRNMEAYKVIFDWFDGHRKKAEQE